MPPVMSLSLAAVLAVPPSGGAPASRPRPPHRPPPLEIASIAVSD